MTLFICCWVTVVLIVMYAFGIRLVFYHREAIAVMFLLLFSVLQGRKNLKYFLFNETRTAISLDQANGS